MEKNIPGGAYQELAPWRVCFLFKNSEWLRRNGDFETWAEYWMNEEEDEDKEEYDGDDDVARCSWMDRSMFLLNYCCLLQRWYLIHVRDLIPKTRWVGFGYETCDLEGFPNHKQLGTRGVKGYVLSWSVGNFLGNFGNLPSQLKALNFHVP